MTQATRVALLPRDGIFCKDGRGWDTSTLGRGHGLDWPWPSTVLGALRTASGRAEEARTGRSFEQDDWRAHATATSLGRTLVLRRPTGAAWAVGHRVWPAPGDAQRLADRGELHRLDPVPLSPSLRTLGRAHDDVLDDAREALWVPLLPDKAKPLGVSRWWSETRFAAWLAGDAVPARADGEVFEPSRRLQAHVQIRPDVLTAAESMLYSHDVVETLEPEAEWALGAEVELPGPGTPKIASLGSDSRLAQIVELPTALFEPPPPVVDAFRRGPLGLRLVIVTPACFARGWLPDGLEVRSRELRGQLGGVDGELVLRAAMVPRPIHVSGWDMVARRPKPGSAMVAPGAVYFFERADGRPFTERDARALWLASIGERTGEGFGRVVPGAWSPTRSKP